MFKAKNIIIWFFIALFSYFLFSTINNNSDLFTADVFRNNKSISWDIYTTDKDNKFTIYSNFESDPGNLDFIMTWDDSEVTINSESIKSEYKADITNISENMISINIPKHQSFGNNNKLVSISYTWPKWYINISDTKMTYNSGTVDNLAITKLE